MKQLILITGGNSGIGRGCVERFLAEGHRIINVDLHHSATKSSDQEIQEVFDLSELQQIPQWIEQIVTQHGVPTILINCAGISRMDYMVDSQLEDWQETFTINLFAMFQVTQAVAQRLIAKGSTGRIINIASQAGKNGYRGLSAYVASKHAVIGFSKTAAIELAPHNILVNTVCPGIVETPMKHRERIEGGRIRGMTAEEVYQEDCSQVPLGRTAQVEDVVGVVEFLCSSKAAYMTGQAINVTGGMTMH